MKRNLLILICICFSLGSNAQSLADLMKEWVGKDAPNFETITLENKKIKLTDLKDKIIVLNFWFMGCAPCIREFPQLNSLVEQYKKKKVVFLAISVDGTEANMRLFLKRRKFDYQIAVSDFSIARLYGVKLYPTNIIINQAGKIVFAESSFQEDIDRKMGEVIDGLLEK